MAPKTLTTDSSEWGDLSEDEAALENLRLSQERAARVLETCLEIVRAPDIIQWAHSYLPGAGYSSGKPIILNGIEDAERSKRVVFSVDVDDSSLPNDVQREISAGLGSGSIKRLDAELL